MIDLITPDGLFKGYFGFELLKSSIQGKNLETVKHLLSRCKNYRIANEQGIPYSTVLDEVLMSDSEEMFEEWERYIDIQFRTRKSRYKIPFGEEYTRLDVLRATAGHPRRVQLLLFLWEKIDLGKILGRHYLGSALVNVAMTTCSVKLAKFLVDCGAGVDYRRSDRYLTPLQHAARQTSAEAAEMMKFLLFCGANPEDTAGSASLRIQDEKGAKGIAKWLGISWDDLVAKAKDETEKAAGKNESNP
jgi:hypothetical protein